MRTAEPPEIVTRLSRQARLSVLDEHAAADLAEAALDSGNEREAISAVAAAAERLGSSSALWQWAALLYRATDQHRHALAAFEQAARLAPRDPKVVHGCARTAAEAGLPATELFERARALAPLDAEVLLGLAAARISAGETDRAIADLDAMLAEHPGWIDGHEKLARIRWAEGRKQEFTLSIRRALSRAPRDPTLWRTLLILLIHAEQYEETLLTAALAKRQLGDHPVIIANEAAALSELGRIAEAEPLFVRLASLNDPNIEVRRIRHLLRSGRVADACRAAERLASGPASRMAWPYVSTAWRLLDDPRWEWLDGQSSLVGVYDLGDAVPMNRLAELLRRLHLSVHHPLDQSLRGGTQTDGMLLQRIEPEIEMLRAAIVAAVERHVAQLARVDRRHPTLGARRDREVRFAGSWSVRLTDGGFHSNHVHPAGWLSSALYVTLPDLGTEERDDAGCLIIGEPQADLGLDLPPIQTIRPKPGRFVLFPSTMWHGTRAFAAGERMTVALDVAMPIG